MVVSPDGTFAVAIGCMPASFPASPNWATVTSDVVAGPLILGIVCSPDERRVDMRMDARGIVHALFHTTPSLGSNALGHFVAASLCRGALGQYSLCP